MEVCTFQIQLSPSFVEGDLPADFPFPVAFACSNSFISIGFGSPLLLAHCQTYSIYTRHRFNVFDEEAVMRKISKDYNLSRKQTIADKRYWVRSYVIVKCLESCIELWKLISTQEIKSQMIKILRKVAH